MRILLCCRRGGKDREAVDFVNQYDEAIVVCPTHDMTSVFKSRWKSEIKTRAIHIIPACQAADTFKELPMPIPPAVFNDFELMRFVDEVFNYYVVNGLFLDVLITASHARGPNSGLFDQLAYLHPECFELKPIGKAHHLKEFACSREFKDIQRDNIRRDYLCGI